MDVSDYNPTRMTDEEWEAMRWRSAYGTHRDVMNIDRGDVDQSWLVYLLSAGEIPITASHMQNTESYPPTWDVVHNWKGWAR